MARKAEATTEEAPARDDPRVEMINRAFPGQIARPRESEVPTWEAAGWTRKG
ncbi:hypothetical protein LCM17_18660 [Cereibacter sphaeroides]|nr:hypothetical protein [Cereibacter sphaeroides]